MYVRDLMTRDLVTLNVHSDLEIAEGLMAVMRIRHLPVVSGSKLVGLITHRDLLRASLSTLRAHSPEEEDRLKTSVEVSSLMRSEVATTHPDEDVRDAIRRMRQHRYGCLPVVDAEGDLVGIVTEADFLELVQVLLDRVDSIDYSDLLNLAAELRSEREPDDGGPE